jgi:hypothetical protein
MDIRHAPMTWTPTTEYPAGSLIQAALARPAGTFLRVIRGGWRRFGNGIALAMQGDILELQSLVEEGGRLYVRARIAGGGAIPCQFHYDLACRIGVVEASREDWARREAAA